MDRMLTGSPMTGFKQLKLKTEIFEKESNHEEGPSQTGYGERHEHYMTVT